MLKETTTICVIEKNNTVLEKWSVKWERKIVWQVGKIKRELKSAKEWEREIDKKELYRHDKVRKRNR